MIRKIFGAVRIAYEEGHTLDQLTGKINQRRKCSKLHERVKNKIGKATLQEWQFRSPKKSTEGKGIDQDSKKKTKIEMARQSKIRFRATKTERMKGENSGPSSMESYCSGDKKKKL